MAVNMTEDEFKFYFSIYMTMLYDSSKMEARGCANHNYVPGKLPFMNGTLSQSAFNLVKISDNHYQLSIDTAIAPYATKINASRYYTSGYWDSFARGVAQKIADDWSGNEYETITDASGSQWKMLDGGGLEAIPNGNK
jgi:hypothetical protein